MLLGSYIERLIREAQANGAFDELPGKGQPLGLNACPGSSTAGMLKGADALPEWLDLRRQIERQENEIAAFLESYRGEYADAVTRIPNPPDTRQPSQSPRASRRLYGSSHRRREQALRAEAVAVLNRRRDVALARFTLLLRERIESIRRHNSLVCYDERRLPIPDMETRLAAFLVEFPRYPEPV